MILLIWAESMSIAEEVLRILATSGDFRAKTLKDHRLFVLRRSNAGGEMNQHERAPIDEPLRLITDTGPVTAGIPPICPPP